LNTFVNATKTTSDLALKMPGWRWSDTMYGAVVTRIAQAVAGEMPAEDAFARIDSDVAEKVKASGL